MHQQSCFFSGVGYLCVRGVFYSVHKDQFFAKKLITPEVFDYLKKNHEIIQKKIMLYKIFIDMVETLLSQK